MRCAIHVLNRPLVSSLIKARSSRSVTDPTQAMANNGAYIDSNLRIDGAPSGPLSGLSFVAKDTYDVKGYRTGFGSPDWLNSHPPATVTAPSIQALLDAGASLVGKTHCDELTYSLNGENAHYGTPVNPACPDRIPGGSSSGSAVAIGSGDADIGLGSDTAGSVRVPAAFCGILGIRPTHGRVSLSLACPLAPSFDTGGWFARDPAVLRLAGAALLSQQGRADGALSRFLVATDAFERADPATAAVLYEAVKRRLPQVVELIGSPVEVKVTQGSSRGDLDAWFNIFRILQASEVWQCHGDWVTSTQPSFGPGIKERFEMASRITAEERSAAEEARAEIVAQIDALLGSDAVLALPTAPGPAPKLRLSGEVLEAFRKNTLSLTVIAGMGGLPQVSIPVGRVDGCPVGLSFVGSRGSDERLLELVEKLYPLLTGK